MAKKPLKTNRGRISPHLQTPSAIHLENLKVEKGGIMDVVGKDGTLFLTPMMKAYCEEFVFGGAFRTIKQWAQYCGVSVDTVRKWNSYEAVQAYLRELREMPLSIIRDNYQMTLGTALNEMVKIMKLDPTVKLRHGRTRISTGLIAEKREMIATLLNFIRDGRPINVVMGEGLMGGGKGGGDDDEHGMTEEEVNRELRELKAIEGVSEPKPKK
jgi:hypothetical protein